MTTRRGLTLLEVMIAMSIFLIILIAVLQAFLGSRAMHEAGIGRDDVTSDGNRILTEIAADLSQSSWFVPNGNALPRTQRPSLPPTDRDALYYPFVQMQEQAAGIRHGCSGNQFAHTLRAMNLVITDGFVGLPGAPSDRAADYDQNSAVDRAAYYASYHARSQELIFVRQTYSLESAADPSRMQRPFMTFRGSIDDWQKPNQHANLGILYPSPWREAVDGSGKVIPGQYVLRGDPIYGSPIVEARLQDNDGIVAFTRMHESDAQGDYATDTATKPTPQPPLREFMYAVVPSPVGLGRLVRAYSSPDTARANGVEVGQSLTPPGLPRAMLVDRVLSDNVVRVAFDTFRTNLDLDVNDVRVRIYLAKRSQHNPAVIIHSVVSALLQMRARGSSADRAEDGGMVDMDKDAAVQDWRIDF